MAHGLRWLIGAASVIVLAVALILIAAGGQSSLAQANIIYVDADATGPVYNGSTWETAFTDLQAALDAASAGDEIWVATGTYKPTDTADRTISFRMKNGVAIYGGFVGTEIVRGLRDWVANPTILSGDIGEEDNPDDNSYHVFYHPASTYLDSTAILDGFTITGGNADGAIYPDHSGGGMVNREASPTLANCTFLSNSADVNGGGMYNWESSPELTKCAFADNASSESGGGIYSTESSAPMLTNCTFNGNLAGSNGGGVANNYASAVLTRCTFENNSAENGGGMYNYESAADLTNCEFTGNSASLGGGLHNYLAGPLPTLTGCTFETNSADYGGGMYNYSSAPVVTNCTFSSNTADQGGGMQNSNARPTLDSCTFTDNSATLGGGMYNTTGADPTLTHVTFSGNSAVTGGGMANSGSSEPTLLNCTFSGNSADNYAGGIYNDSSSPTLINSTCHSNTADYGGGMYNHQSSPVLTNCTLSANSATSAGGGMYSTFFSSPALTNCILWGNTDSQMENNGSSPVVEFTNIQGGCGAIPENDCRDGNIDKDPLFVDASAGDLRLQLTSPAIDAGDNEAPGLADVTTDLGRHPRFADVDSMTDTGNGTPPIVDMGAYEAPPEVIFVDQDAMGANDGTSWVDAFHDLQDALAWAVDGIEIWVAAGTYKPTWRFDTGDPRSATFQMVNGVAIYGGFDPSAGAVDFDGRDWLLHETVLSGDLDGNDGPEFTNNDENSYHVFYHPAGTNLDSSAILDGFVIRGGNAEGYIGHYHGGGVYNDASSPTLTNVSISENSAGNYGGGMHNINASSPALTNCTFSDNSATFGGGMNNNNSSPTLTDSTFVGNLGGGMHNYASASPLMTNCTFSGNWDGGMRNTGSSPTLIDCAFSDNSGSSGGGMYNTGSSPILINCTFSGNWAAIGGGMYNTGSSPVLTNCTFSGNSSSLVPGGAMISYGGSPVLINCILWGDTLPETYGDEMVVTYSNIQGGYEGEGNIEKDPLFLDPDNGDLHLGGCSPCIDAGTNGALYLPVHDFEGDARIFDGDGDSTATVDMGVDEALWHPIYLPLVLRGY